MNKRLYTFPHIYVYTPNLYLKKLYSCFFSVPIKIPTFIYKFFYVAS